MGIEFGLRHAKHIYALLRMREEPSNDGYYTNLAYITWGTLEYRAFSFDLKELKTFSTIDLRSFF